MLKGRDKVIQVRVTMEPLSRPGDSEPIDQMKADRWLLK